MKKRKFLSVLLVLAMTLSLLPTAALAAALPSETGAVASWTDRDKTNYYYYDDLKEAVNAAAPGSTVQLLDNVDYTSKGTCLDISKELTLDLNGHSINALANGSHPTATHFIRVENGGDLTVDDTTEDKNGSITAGYKANSNMLVIEVMSGAKLTVKAGTIQNAAGTATNWGSSSVYVRSGGVFNLEGGTIHGEDAKMRAYPVWNVGDTTISGGVITSNDSSVNGITHNGGTLTITNVTVDTTAAAVSVSSSASATTISGGTFTKPLKSAWIGDGSAAVYDGTDTTVGSDAPADYKACINGKVYYTATADDAMQDVVKGDTLVLRETPTASTKTTFGLGSTLTVTPENGATFDSSLITVSTGYKLTTSVSGASTTYTVAVDENAAKAIIGDTYYLTFAAANLGAKDGDTITLLKDDILSGGWTVAKNITIDLNGHELTSDKSYKNGQSKHYATMKFSGADKTLTITDSSAAKTGKIVNTADAATTSKYGHALAASAGNVVIQGGTFTSQSMEAIYANGGAITVTGGTFSTDPSSFVTVPYAVTGAGPFTVACAHTGTLNAHAAVPADCTNDGTKAYWECTNCGKLFSDALATTEIAAPETDPANGHTPVPDGAVSSTCTTTGLTEGSHCSVCGTVLVAQTTVPADGHSFGAWTVTKEPTTTEAGSKTRECSVCHVEETVTIPALGVTTFTITPSVTNGTITPSEAVDVEEGGSQRFDFAPNSGYELGSVKVDGADVDADSYYTFANVTANHTIVVAFTAKAPDTIPVESVTLNMTNMTLHSIGASNTTMPLTVTVTPANATDKTVTFSSSNEAVATVDQDGYVVAKAAGTAIITATVGGKTATCTVTVELKPAESHTIVTDTFTLDFGDAVVEEMTIPLGSALEAEETEVKVVRLGYGAAFTFTSRMTRRNWITYAELYQRSPGEAGYYKCTGVWDDESTVATEQNKPYTITFPSRQQIEDTFKSLDEYEIDLSDAEILYHYAVMEENAESWELDPDVVGEFFVILTDEDTPEPQKATVTFNSNGGSAVASQTVTVGGTAQKPADPTRTGYTFAGWYTDEACTMAYTFGEPVTADLTLYAKWTKNSTTGGGGGGSSSGGSSSGGSSSGGSSSGGSSSSSETTKNPDGSTTTTTTDKATGTVTEVTKETDGSTTTVETKKDGTVTETVETANGTTGTVVADKNGNVTEVSASVSAAAADDAAKTGAAVTLPVEVPVTKTTEAAPAVEVSVPKSSGSVKVEIPVENVTAGTVAVIVKADGTEEIVKTSVTTENGVALTLDGSATVKIIDNSKDFQDVQPVNHWAQDSIDFVTSRELFNGTSTTTFSPNEPTTRAQLMTVLARLDGADTTGAALDKGMSWAVEKGVSDGSNPNGTISRQQLAVMLYRYAGSPATQQTLDYPDADKVDGYAEDAMKWAVENGIVGGMDDGTLNPQGPATRAQVAAMMARFCAKMA